MATVPFSSLDREFAENREEYCDIIQTVLAHGRVLQGAEVTGFEKQLAHACQRRHAIAVGSCTDALFFALKAAGVQAGDHVLVTDFSFVASASAIVRAGARPIFVDVDADYQMDLNDAHQRITPQTRALVYVHLYGRMSNPKQVEQFCREHQLVLIEDAAQALGARYANRPAGSLGQASCFSFDPTKVVSAPGSGGAVVTDDDQLADQVRRLRYHGKTASGEFGELGFNSQMASLTAALLGSKLRKADDWLKRRTEVANQYDQHLPDELIRPSVPAGSVHVYHKYVLTCSRRDELLRHMTQCGIDCRVHYARPLHAEPMFGVPSGNYPRASAAAQQVISLPMHPFLTADEVARVVAAARSFFAGAALKAA